MKPALLRAVVLRTRPFSETSLWVRLYSESHGKLSGLAKGARRGNERVFTPLIEIEVKGYPPRSEEHGLWTLARPDIIGDWRGLTADTDRLAYAWSMLELLDHLVEEAHPQPELYAQLTAALDRLEASDPGAAAAVLVWFLLRLIDQFGYSLQYEICPRCNRPLVFPVGALVPSLGGIVCKRCAPPGSQPLSQELWEVLVSLSAQDAPPTQKLPLAHRDWLLATLLDYLSFHTERPVRLKSLELLSDFRNSSR